MAMPGDLLTNLHELLREGKYPEILAACGGPESSEHARPEVRLLVATAAARTGDLEGGNREARTALRGFEARGDDDGAMRCENLLGAIAFERGELPEARARFSAARQIADRLGDRLMSARAANNLASATHLLGEADEARRVYREALLAYQRLGDHHRAAETYHNLALVAREEGDFAGASVAATHAVRHAMQVNDPGLRALVLTGRAETAILLGDGAVARETLDRAATLAREAGDEGGLIEIERVRALGLLQAGDLSGALRAAERARRQAGRLRIPLLEGECAAIAARAFAALGRPVQAARRRDLARRRFAALGARALLQRLETV